MQTVISIDLYLIMDAVTFESSLRLICWTEKWLLLFHPCFMLHCFVGYYYYYYCYYFRYYYYYYYYYCLGLPETAFPKRLAVFSLKTTTNITDFESNILLVRSMQQRKWKQSPPKRVIYKVCKYIKFATLESPVHVLESCYFFIYFHFL